MNRNEIAHRTPHTALETVENWLALSPDARRIRAAQILQDDDREEREAGLAGLLQAYLFAFGRHGDVYKRQVLHLGQRAVPLG